MIRSRQHAVLAGMSLCLLAAACLWLANEGRNWPGVVMERAINRGEAVATDKLVAFWQDTREVGDTPLPGGHAHLPGLVGYTLAQDPNLPVFRRAEFLLQAEQATRAALLREPADARAWARLAWFLDQRKGQASQLLDALRLSMYFAPADGRLVFWRVQTAAKYRPNWNADFEQLLARQVVLGWRVSPARLVHVVQTTNLRNWVREVLNNSGADMEQFDVRMNKA